MKMRVALVQSKYDPHQGQRECARRVRQRSRGQLPAMKQAARGLLLKQGGRSK